MEFLRFKVNQGSNRMISKSSKI